MCFSALYLAILTLALGLVEPSIRAKSPTSPSVSLPDDASHTKILQLLRILHKLNESLVEESGVDAQPLPEAAFVNNKLTAKLARQLEEPLIVARYLLYLLFIVIFSPRNLF